MSAVTSIERPRGTKTAMSDGRTTPAANTYRVFPNALVGNFGGQDNEPTLPELLPVLPADCFRLQLVGNVTISAPPLVRLRWNLSQIVSTTLESNLGQIGCVLRC